jgi:hypothetical protein
MKIEMIGRDKWTASIIRQVHNKYNNSLVWREWLRKLTTPCSDNRRASRSYHVLCYGLFSNPIYRIVVLHNYV